jgi:hypothetical protein
MNPSYRKFKGVYTSILMTLIGLPVELMISILGKDKVPYFLDIVKSED